MYEMISLPSLRTLKLGKAVPLHSIIIEHEIVKNVFSISKSN